MTTFYESIKDESWKEKPGRKLPEIAEGGLLEIMNRDEFVENQIGLNAADPENIPKQFLTMVRQAK